MNIKRRDFLAGAAIGLAAAGLPRLARGADDGAAPFKTILKKALVRPRLTPEVVKVLKENGYPGVELQDKTVTEAEARAARRLAEDEGLLIHSFMGGWFMFNAKEPDKRKAERAGHQKITSIDIHCFAFHLLGGQKTEDR